MIDAKETEMIKSRTYLVAVGVVGVRPCYLFVKGIRKGDILLFGDLGKLHSVN